MLIINVIHNPYRKSNAVNIRCLLRINNIGILVVKNTVVPTVQQVMADVTFSSLLEREIIDTANIQYVATLDIITTGVPLPVLITLQGDSWQCLFCFSHRTKGWYFCIIYNFFYEIL